MQNRNALGAALLCTIACFALLASTLRPKDTGVGVLVQSSNPYELRRQQESQEYDRYLLHEVMWDGNRPKRVAPKQTARKQAARKSAQRPSDRMSAGQADADFNTYFAAQAAKAEKEDNMRNTENRIRLVRAALDEKKRLHRAQQLHANADPRVAGTVGWDYSWHRASGAGDLPQEKFSTDSWTAQNINERVAQAAPNHYTVPRSVKRTISAPRAAKKTPAAPGGNPDLPSMPGSFSELERALS